MATNQRERSLSTGKPDRRVPKSSRLINNEEPKPPNQQTKLNIKSKRQRLRDRGSKSIEKERAFSKSSNFYIANRNLKDSRAEEDSKGRHGEGKDQYFESQNRPQSEEAEKKEAKPPKEP